MLTIRVYLHSFSRCWLEVEVEQGLTSHSTYNLGHFGAPKSAKSRKIPTEFELIARQGHPRSSILVSIDSAHAIFYQSLIVTLDLSPIVFDIGYFHSGLHELACAIYQL